jgi:3-hydroxybutyryl-CoA dehydrogenase
VEKIAVLGAGTMGSGITQVFAQAGYEVLLRDVKEEYIKRGIKTIERNLQRSIDKGRLEEGEKEKIISRIKPVTDVALLAEVDFVIEAINEDMDLKKKVFKELDEVCKEEAILTSNTSALSITEISMTTSRPEKVIGVHFFNPVPVMKLVELIRGITTSEETFSKINKVIKDIGKNPIEVKEAPGFVVNRLLIPMINEAAFLLNEGIASVEDIDAAMVMGANHPIGPLGLADLIGLDVCLAIMETLYEEMGDPKYRPCPLLRKKVRAGQLGRKAGEGFYIY